ncbi:alpha/beta hydrolase [Sediminicoccus sp. KRV36]|uniref:alpha/beta hydrolase n=1 Tax=Sediminicoccus sp. KRV36 TaxID=3133721 RepID=UPI00200F0094|nr:alpha/beta hydrolase [Sediminicoccus rosea]UPY38440.1 alpha/beta hydrolase [Sediminicoccus rosea]
MPDDPRMDPEMARFNAHMASQLAAYPPIILPNPPRSAPFDEPRRINDAPQIPLSEGGPRMASSQDIWLPIRGRRMQLRFHRPSDDPNLPVLIYLHGGGWVWGSIDTHDRLMRSYAAASGCAVLGPDYALSPEAVFPQAIEECAGVLRHVARHGADLGLDGRRIILGGDSAGANLATGLALLNAEQPDPVPLAGLLLNYGVFDHDLDTPSYREFRDGYGLTLAKMRFYWDAYCPDAVARHSPFASPMRGNLSVLPPCLLHIAELDVLCAENLAFAEKLRAAGVSLECRTFPGTVHGFLRALGRVGAADRAVEAAGAWLRARFGS